MTHRELPPSPHGCQRIWVIGVVEEGECWNSSMGKDLTVSGTHAESLPADDISTDGARKARSRKHKDDELVMADYG